MINDSSAEYFGYIGDKSYWCKGLSRLIFELIRVECVKNNITDIWLRVSRENIMAIKAYEKNGFVVSLEKSTASMLYMNGEVN
ncbi:GNAT family N-acetyltransferase [Vibrio metschnikovii]|nr:GNAT family N-acetyltransferase [Vibrio metschnikovii]